MEDHVTVISRSRTADNAANLAPAFLAEMQRRYGDTPLGRQELEGEIVDERMTGLWKRAWLDQGRLAARPELIRIVVAVDPPVTSTAGSDSCGIIVAGLGVDGRGYVIGDRTIQGRDPGHLGQGRRRRLSRLPRPTASSWRPTRAATSSCRLSRASTPTLPVKKVYASRGKYLRAEPVSVLYAEGRVAHVGEFPELERQMCDFAADGLTNGKSPDRLDALVWALTELMLIDHRSPLIRPL